VAIQGNNVLIGARDDNTYGPDVGQAHLFNALSGNLIQTFNDPTVTTSDGFGGVVALDGDNVLIGAAGDDTYGTDIGQAYLFEIIPEPSTFILAIVGLLSLVFHRRRRRR